MTLDLVSLGAFTGAATLLLGSPGPGIAALVAVGRSAGFARGLRFYGGLQLGLALAAAVSVAGLLSLIEVIPGARLALGFAAAAYLAYLAWRIATAPVGQPADADTAVVPATTLGGFVLGVSNPKAYVAFVSLAAAYVLVRANAQADAAMKWAVIVAVIIVVDLAWLWFGGVLGRARLGPRAERAVNIAMGAAILATAIAAIV